MIPAKEEEEILKRINEREIEKWGRGMSIFSFITHYNLGRLRRPNCFMCIHFVELKSIKCADWMPTKFHTQILMSLQRSIHILRCFANARSHKKFHSFISFRIKMRRAPHILHENIESDKKRGAKKSDHFMCSRAISNFFFLLLAIFLLPFQKCSK